MFFMTTWPWWLAAIALIVPGTILAMAGPYIVRRRVPLAKLRPNNEVAGFKFATVGVMYAVLLAFAVIVVWEKFGDADDAVANEGGAAATVYRLADGLDDAGAASVTRALTTYIRVVVTEEWPAMTRGEESNAATRALDGVYRAVLAYRPLDGKGVAVIAEILRQLDTLTQERRERLVLAAGIVPRIIWGVLCIGAFLTLSFTWFFGTENLPAQSMMTGMLAVLMLSGLLIIVVIDHPFAGSVSVHPDALIGVLDDFEPATARP